MALIATAWHRRWWLIGCVLFCTVVAGVYAIRMPRIYRATVILVPATPAGGMGGGLTSALGSLGGLASFAGIDLNSNASKTDEVLAVLTSRQFIERFLRDKQLLPVLYAGDWDKQKNDWKGGTEPHNYAQAYRYFKGIMKIEREKGAGLIMLHVNWTDGKLAAEWANSLIDRANAEMKTRAMEEADHSVRFLEEEAKRTSLVPTQQAIGRLMESQINQRMLANVTTEYALRVVDRAMAPDLKDPYSPRRLLIIGGGFVVGVAIGLFLVWFLAEPSDRRREP